MMGGIMQKDAPCGDTLATETDKRHVEGVHAMLKEDCSMNRTLTAAEVGISTGGVFHTLTRQLGKGKECAKWIDSMLAE
jgi:hypothetical protein